MSTVLILAWMTLGILGVALSQWPVILAFSVIGAAGFWLTLRDSQPFMDGTVYTAIRLSKGNLLFPTQVVIEPARVIRHQARIIGYEEESIAIQQIASVRITTGPLWSDVIIESTGGQNQIVCHGHTNRDAIAIKTEIERRLSDWAEIGHRFPERSVSFAPFHHTTASTLLLSLYPAPPSGIESLHPWPTPVKRLQIGADDDLRTCVLQLLQEGDAGCHVHVVLL